MEEGNKPEIVEVDGIELNLDPIDTGSDAIDTGSDAIHTALPPRMEAWRRRSATGAILTGIGLGLKQVLEPERDEPSIIVQTSGTPPSDLPVEAELGGIHPSNNVVRIRPWLFEKGDAQPGPGLAPQPSEEAPDAGAPGEAR